MRDRWTERLSDYLDDELAPAQRAALEAHLDACTECTAVLAELREVVRLAREQTAREPSADLWPGIEARLQPRDVGGGERVVDLPARRAARGGRRIAFTVPQLIAASVALAAISVGTFRLVVQPGDRPDASAPAVATAPASVGEAHLVAAGFEDYGRAVAQLERDLELRRGSLDSGTVKVVERNLRIIDQAIAEAARALDEDPASTYLATHVASAMKRKVDLLRQATSLAVKEI